MYIYSIYSFASFVNCQYLLAHASRKILCGGLVALMDGVILVVVLDQLVGLLCGEEDGLVEAVPLNKVAAHAFFVFTGIKDSSFLGVRLGANCFS